MTQPGTDFLLNPTRFLNLQLDRMLAGNCSLICRRRRQQQKKKHPKLRELIREPTDPNNLNSNKTTDSIFNMLKEGIEGIPRSPSTVPADEDPGELHDDAVPRLGDGAVEGDVVHGRLEGREAPVETLKTRLCAPHVELDLVVAAQQGALQRAVGQVVGEEQLVENHVRPNGGNSRGTGALLSVHLSPGLIGVSVVSYPVDDVDEAVDGGQVVCEDGGVSNAEHLTHNRTTGNSGEEMVGSRPPTIRSRSSKEKSPGRMWALRDQRQTNDTSSRLKFLIASLDGTKTVKFPFRSSERWLYL
ncbi:hypothetical protein EYF80_029090 [Liparis tanakae]|uniref:Uncharacterized protein n=1 Tax=Liparis tanakae TaxID=230148 RepID=A0A4Z2H4P3_9TELE|nr:hypothetical protein EYF80_029090 [Liparis tanakae]